MAEKGAEKAPGAFSLLGTASTMGLHMVSGPVVGGGLGWLIDHWLDSWPIASSIGFVLGLAAGFRNVWADARYLERSNAVIDAEKKKKEEGQAAQNSETVAKRTVAESNTSPVVDIPASDRPENKAEEKASSAEDSPREDFTASVLSGMASPEEKEFEELDETVEAIRRVLGNDPQKEAGKGGADNAEKGRA